MDVWWTYGGRLVDVRWTSGGRRTLGGMVLSVKPQAQVQSKVKTGAIADRHSTTEQSEFTICPPYIHLTSFYVEVPPR